MNTDTLVATIQKNALDDIRVRWSEYKGHRYLDIRVFTEIEGKPDKVPTKKGVALRPDLIPELMKALESAQAAQRTDPVGSSGPVPGSAD